MIDYAHALHVHGLTVQASAEVSPYALAEAAWLVRKVLPARAARRPLD